MTALIWLCLGFLCGIAVATIRANDVFSENERLRQALANVRLMIGYGNTRSAVAAISRALEDECAA